MNKKRRSLTLAALAVFGLIIFFHYCDPWFHQRQLSFGVGGAWHGGRYIAGSIEPLIADVRMPLFALAVVYAGLFFLFGGKDAEPVPRRPINWRAIILWTIAGFLITGGTYGIVLSNQYQQEHERQRNEFLRHQEERRKAIDKEIASNIEAEASKHRISTKEIDLINMQLGPVQHAVGVFHLTGRIRNHAPHWNTLWSIDLKITIREKGSADILGEATWPITITVPGNQTRGIDMMIKFSDMPWIGDFDWTYTVTELRAGEAHYWVKPNGPQNLLGITPAPSPKRGAYDDLVEEAKAKKKHGTAKPGDVIEAVDPKTGKRKKIDLSNLPDAAPTP